MSFELEQIKEMIYIVRGQKVMLDSDLAELYGVETKRLNEQVRRNIDRFPTDFMFECNSRELEILKSQIATSKMATTWNHMRRYSPMVFTENGVAMLSGVLNSKQAVQVNIAIMRIFTKLRSFHMLEKDIVKQMDDLKEDTNKVFKIVFERLDDLETSLPSFPSDRQKIGIKDK